MSIIFVDNYHILHNNTFLICDYTMVESVDKYIQKNMYPESERLLDVEINSLSDTKRISGKVLLLNGSPHANGSTATVLNAMTKIFEIENIETEMIHVGLSSVIECRSCDKCTEINRCCIDDIVNEIAHKFESSSGIVVASPVHYASPTGAIMSVMNRLFYSTYFSKQMKVGACVICGGRGDNTSAFDMLNKYFYISGMPVASATYCNQVHSVYTDDEIKQISGLCTVRNLARNMSFMIKAFAEAKEKYGYPLVER